MVSKEIEIINKLGLHARAAAKLVHTSARFSSTIKVRKGHEEVDGKSILGILLLAAARGTCITVTAQGADEAEALAALQDLIGRKFDEVE
ncbi:MAG TPA: HPr family phosphocarrier protein [Thermoanaerobaculia bacterium]|nr:HPr family phosphocarrier protein [Thermoanaerobaculia bacterium]